MRSATNAGATGRCSADTAFGDVYATCDCNVNYSADASPVVASPEPYYIEPLFTRDPAQISEIQVLMAMMAIKGIYAEYGVQRLNHGIGFDMTSHAERGAPANLCARIDPASFS